MPTVEWNRLWGREFAQFAARRKADRLYGLRWGNPGLRGFRYFLARIMNPTIPGPLYRVVDEYVKPYVNPSATVLEIGPGGGRWTQYLISARKLICVDISDQFFPELKARFPQANLDFYQPAGCDLKGVAEASVDFVFSFGAFVHIEPEGIQQYLQEIKRVLRPGGIAVIHYANKDKLAGRLRKSFSNMTPGRMEAMAPMRIVKHDTRLLNHSSIVVMRKS